MEPSNTGVVTPEECLEIRPEAKVLSVAREAVPPRKAAIKLLLEVAEIVEVTPMHDEFEGRRVRYREIDLRVLSLGGREHTWDDLG